MVHPRLSVGEFIMFIHAQRTVIYGVVIVGKILERTNENYGFKMTALEMYRLYLMAIFNIFKATNNTFKWTCYQSFKLNVTTPVTQR